MIQWWWWYCAGTVDTLEAMAGTGLQEIVGRTTGQCQARLAGHSYTTLHQAGHNVDIMDALYYREPCIDTW